MSVEVGIILFGRSPEFLKQITKIFNLVELVRSLKILEGYPYIFGRLYRYPNVSEVSQRLLVTEVDPFRWYD